MAEQEARRWVIVGRVQGVGYRHFALQAAAALGIRGWIRNLSEGGVEVQAAASPQALDRFKAELRRGPRGAMVEDVEETLLIQIPNWQGFNVVF
jgi:acylphosphatase